MSNQQILTKAIKKAIANGWKIPTQLTFTNNDEFLVYLNNRSTPADMKWLKFKVNELIYDHDFARALWGEKLVHGFKSNMLGQTQ